MAKSPQLTDYVRLIIELFDRFRQERSARAVRNWDDRSDIAKNRLSSLLHADAVSAHPCLQESRWRWLHKHPEVVEMLGWEQIPHCTTIGRRYMETVLELVAASLCFSSVRTGQGWLNSLTRAIWWRDKSLFKARGSSLARAHAQSGSDSAPVAQGWIRMQPGAGAPIMAGYTATDCI